MTTETRITQEQADDIVQALGYADLTEDSIWEDDTSEFVYTLFDGSTLSVDADGVARLCTWDEFAQEFVTPRRIN